MFRPVAVSVAVSFILAPSASIAQLAQTLSVPADSPRWALEGRASVAKYRGRKSLMLDGGAAVLKDFEMRDAVIDVGLPTRRKAAPSNSHAS